MTSDDVADLLDSLVVRFESYGYTGTYQRGAWLADVNLRRARMLVGNPKVKSQKRRYVALSAAARAALADSLPARKAYLRDECRMGESEWLLPLGKEVGPTREDGTLAVVVGPWGYAVLRKLAAGLRKRAGVVFSWKTMRSTFGQRLVNRGVPLEQTSVAMRHKKVETTRKYYVVLDQERALAATIRALDGPVAEASGPALQDEPPSET